MVILENEKNNESDLGVCMYLGVTPPQVEIKKSSANSRIEKYSPPIRFRGPPPPHFILNFYYVS